MKTITLTQPWASLVALREKRIETRSWRTAYRGPLAIHAAKGFPDGAGARSLCMEQPFRRILLEAGYHLGALHTLPLGAVVATCVLMDCVQIVSTDSVRRMFKCHAAPGERAFGDYTPGRFMWLLRDVVALPEPIPARGMQGLWEWEPPAGFIS